MSKKKNNIKTNDSNVEFGMEFGDINASKLYDTAPLAKDKVKSEKRNVK